MDFKPSPAQQMLVSTARDFLRRHSPPERVQAWALDERGFDEKLWSQMAELGWPGLLVEPALNGSGGSMLDVVLLVEQMGYACLSGPFVTSAVAVTSLLIGAGAADQQKRLLPALASGERIATLALTEENGSSDPDDVALACRVPGRLTGRKLFVKDAHVADLLVVVVREAKDLSALILPTDRPGISRLPLAPISGDQAIQHTCADLVRDVDTARGLLYLAAWKTAEGLPATSYVAMAKAHAAEACLAVARRGHQVFGAIGYCEEHPLHLIHKRIQAASLDFGDAP